MAHESPAVARHGLRETPVKRHIRQTIAALRDSLPQGTTVHYDDNGRGKHARLVITQGDRTVRLPVSTSPATSASYLPAVRQALHLFDSNGRLKPPPRNLS